MVAKVLLVALVLVVGLFAVIAFQPSDYRVVRSATIAAPPPAVFGLVNDFRKWDAWSPWAKLDPNMKVSYAGSEFGQGAVYSWVGNDDVGEGRMTILESRPNEIVRIKLDFLKPFESTSTTVFQFVPEGSGTRVEWAMSGNNNLISKAFCLFMGGMDKMVGPDFEKGLAKLKTESEASR